MQVDEAGFYNRLLDYHNILYLCHRNADPDAISSAFALSESIGGKVGLVDGCNRVAALLVDKLEIDVIDNPDPKDYDLVVVVDTSTSAQLNDIKLTNYCVIDHHATTALTASRLARPLTLMLSDLAVPTKATSPPILISMEEAEPPKELTFEVTTSQSPTRSTSARDAVLSIAILMETS